MMRGKYDAAFLLPLGAEKYLEEDGWEFGSNDFLPKQVVPKLADMLNLTYSKTSLDISYYVNDFIQVSFFCDGSEDNIKHIYFQVYEGKLGLLKQAFFDSSLGDFSELFIPKERSSESN